MAKIKAKVPGFVSLSDDPRNSVHQRKRVPDPPSWWLDLDLESRMRYVDSIQTESRKARWEPVLHLGLDKDGNPTKRSANAEAKRQERNVKKDHSDAKAKLDKEQEKINRAKQKAKERKGTETTAEKEARQKAPVIEKSWRDGAAKLATKGTLYANKLTRKISPEHKDAIGKFFNEAFKKDGEPDEDVKALVTETVKPLARVLMGAALVGLTMAGGGLLITAIASAYTEGAFELPEFLSESSSSEYGELDTTDPVQFLVHDFTRWANSINPRPIADKVAEVVAMQRVIARQEGASEEEFKSTSAASPALRFSCCPTQKHLPEHQRQRYLINLGGQTIGRIHSDKKINGNTLNGRSWVCTLKDAFDETAFHSNVRKNMPFTLATAKGVILRNPMRMTFDEAKSWVRTVVDKDLL